MIREVDRRWRWRSHTAGRIEPRLAALDRTHHALRDHLRVELSRAIRKIEFTEMVKRRLIDGMKSAVEDVQAK